ncbi:MAG: hypothetical protein HY367_00060 [Candidatus Aenigmarchaeota archaeon]|nr:hypothetical protein [Candidatus Aenigmarchaeota archaeon]
MDIYQMEKFLRNIDPDRLKINSRIRTKIERKHNINIAEVLQNLRNPDLLAGLSRQSSKKPHDETYGLLFELTKRKRLFIVITYKTLENKIYLVTAFKTTKKAKKMLMKNPLRR